MDRSTLVSALLKLRHEGRSGVLVVRAGGVRTFLYLLRGELVFAEEESIGESLGRMLVRQQALTLEQYSCVIDRMTRGLIHNEQLRFGEVAVELGFMNAAAVQRALADQVRWKIIRTLERADHEFDFAESTGQVEGLAVFPLMTLEPLIMEACRWVDDERKLATLGLLAQERPLVLRESHETTAHRYQLSPDEHEFLVNVNGQRTVRELIDFERTNGADVTALLTALAVSKGIAYTPTAPKRVDPLPLPAPNTAQTAAPAVAVAMATATTAAAATGPAAATATARATTGDGNTRTQGSSVDGPAPTAATPRVHRTVVATPAQFVPFKGLASEAKSDRDVARERADRAFALMKLQRLATASASVAGGVPSPLASPASTSTSSTASTPTASTASTPTASTASTPTASTVSTAKTSDVATTTNSRSEHEARLLAEQTFQRGRTHLLQGQMKLAHATLEKARQLQPASVEYQLYAMWAGFVAGEVPPQEARSQLRTLSAAAVKTDPHSAFGYYVIGEIALLDKSEGTAKRAFLHALKLDPKHADAARRLRLLTKK